MADEKQVRSALFMDRAHSLGNSEDVWLRRALHVKIGNKESEAVPVFIVNGDITGGDDFFIDTANVDATPGTVQTLFTYTVPTGKRLVLHHLRVNARMTSEYELYSGSSLIASGKLGAARPSDDFRWSRPRDISAGTILKLEYFAVTGETPRQVNSHLEGALFDIT